MFRSPPLLLLALLGGLLAETGHGAEDTPVVRPVRIVQTAEPSVPLDLRTDVPSTGEVALVINVDADGRLSDWLIARYSHEIYARAAADAMQVWRFRPATVDGRPVNARAVITINFETRGRVLSSVAVDTMGMLLNRIGRFEMVNRIAEPQQLDAPLTVEYRVEPRFPSSLIGSRSQAASVTLDFYVDERGRPRMPTMDGGTNPALAAAAADALMQWKFSVPTRHGEPVVVRARQEFVLTNLAGMDS